MKNRKGFTLVELLAVIVILAIIMIIAIPSVLTTIETANRKTMLEYNQKVLLALERKYMEDKNFGNIKRTGGNYHYVYDIKKDLDLTSTGGFFGFADVRTSNGKMYYDIFLANDNYVLYSSSDSHEPTVDDFIDRANLEAFYSQATDGAITNLDQITPRTLVSIIIDFTLCSHGEDIYYEAATGDKIGQTEYKKENWVNDECTDNNVWDIINSLK